MTVALLHHRIARFKRIAINAFLGQNCFDLVRELCGNSGVMKKKEQKEFLTKKIEMLEKALQDAVSTYQGEDKVVTAERIEAWQNALGESNGGAIPDPEDKRKNIGVSASQDEISLWTEAANRAGVSLNEWASIVLKDAPALDSKIKKKNKVITLTTTQEIASIVRKKKGVRSYSEFARISFNNAAK